MLATSPSYVVLLSPTRARAGQRDSHSRSIHDNVTASGTDWTLSIVSVVACNVCRRAAEDPAPQVYYRYAATEEIKEMMLWAYPIKEAGGWRASVYSPARLLCARAEFHT